MIDWLVDGQCRRPVSISCQTRVFEARIVLVQHASITTFIFIFIFISMQVGKTGADPKWDVQWSGLNPPGGTGR